MTEPTDSGRAADTHQSAGKSCRAWLIFVILFVLALAGDLWSKAAVFDWVLETEPQTASREILPGVMRFTLSTNPGIVFGFNKLPAAVVVAMSMVAVLVVLYFFATSDRKARFSHAGLAMILAGALGNLYDRLFSEVQLPGRELSVHHVRDFIDLSQAYYPWIFNIADVFLVVGVAILLLASLAQWRRETKQAQADAKSQ